MSAKPLPESIDPEIRELVMDLNALEFVRRTENSCAGVGVNDEGKPHLVSAVAHGYISVRYVRSEGARVFHNRMSEVMYGYESWERVEDGGEWRVYRMRGVDTEAQARAVWARVHRLILKGIHS